MKRKQTILHRVSPFKGKIHYERFRRIDKTRKKILFKHP